MESNTAEEHLEMNSENVYVNQLVDNGNVEHLDSDSDEKSDIGDYTSPNIGKDKLIQVKALEW